MVRGADEGIDLVRAALLIAAERYPQLDIEDCAGRLDGLGATLRRRLRPDIGPIDAIRSLNRYMFDELGFQGASDDYYDPRNSFLNEVLERRIGIPITLAIVYIALARAIGLPVHGISFPGHFLVRCAVHDGTVVLDPFHKGVSLGIPELKKRLASLQGEVPTNAVLLAMLAPAGPREVLARLLRNLRSIYTHHKQYGEALSATTQILDLNPDNAHEWRERAGLHLMLECFRAALGDFQRYLALVPDAEDADAIRARIVDLQATCARLN
jgi:regulator of sirC expression with transglutaminase-like and TPR domain